MKILYNTYKIRTKYLNDNIVQTGKMCRIMETKVGKTWRQLDKMWQ